MKFSKWHGLGNDFILVEPDRNPGANPPGMARRLCDRRLGIGADGLVTIRPLGGDAFEMRIFNSDGGECEMCGNATRCVALYLRTNHLSASDEFELHTRAGIIRPRVCENHTVRVDMGTPRLRRREIPVAGGDPEAAALDLEVTASGRKFHGVGISMGNPHCVIFVPDIREIELENWGPQIENAPLFPQKTNVEFVEAISPQMVRMRVWERGCGVTPACGTGSCATVAAGVFTGRTGRHVSVLLDGGELQIEYSENDSHIHMTGPATEVFRGEFIERY